MGSAVSALSRAVARAGGTLAFERAQHAAWRRIAFALLALNVVTAATLAVWVSAHDTVYIAVAATPDGRLIKLTPLDEPTMSDTALRQWTVATVTEAFTLGFHDWRMRLAAIRERFTDGGYESFVAALEESQFLERLRTHRQVASTVARGAAVITQTRVFGDRVGWSMEVPILVTFQAGQRRLDQDLLARVLVMRVPLSERAQGIAVEQLIAVRAAGTAG